jgi:hypothetical protein
MEALADGTPFDSAVHLVTGRTIDQFEYAWRIETRRAYGGAAWLTGLGLWMILAVTVVAGAGWRRRMDAPRRAALDVDWPEPPADPLDPGGETG